MINCSRLSDLLVLGQGAHDKAGNSHIVPLSTQSSRGPVWCLGISYEKLCIFTRQLKSPMKSSLEPEKSAFSYKEACAVHPSLQ